MRDIKEILYSHKFDRRCSVEENTSKAEVEGETESTDLHLVTRKSNLETVCHDVMIVASSCLGEGVYTF
jgi:hypothetical protein